MGIISNLQMSGTESYTCERFLSENVVHHQLLLTTPPIARPPPSIAPFVFPNISRAQRIHNRCEEILLLNYSVHIATRHHIRRNIHLYIKIENKLN